MKGFLAKGSEVKVREVYKQKRWTVYFRPNFPDSKKD